MGYLKKQRFSIRKLAIGVASVLLFNMISLTSGIVKADEVLTSQQQKEKISVSYISIKLEELTEIEKEILKKEDISKEIVEKNDVIIEVYSEQKSKLPSTGNINNNHLFGLGILCLLAVYKIGKNKNKILLSLIIITSSTVGSLNSVGAENTLSFIEKSTATYTLGANLEKIDIPGYNYVGYIKSEDVIANKEKFIRFYELIGPELEIIKNYNKKNESLINVLKEENKKELTTEDKPLEELKEGKEEPKLEDEILEETSTRVEKIPFVEIEENTEELYEGERVVKVLGENGERTIITKNYILNGNVEKTEEVPTEITKSPVNQIVQVGTKKKETSKPTENLTIEENPEANIEEEISTRVDKIPFTEIEENTEELYEGERVVKVLGENGERTITTKNYILNGNVEKTEEVSTEITKSPVNKIAQVGTKKKETSKPTENLTIEENPEANIEEELSTRVEKIPFTEIEDNTEELYEGERVVKVLGENGERTITTKNYILNGNVEKTEEVSTEITKSPVNQIVQVGTKKKETSKPTENLTIEEDPESNIEEELSTKVESIPFVEIEENTEELYEGERVVKVSGENGERTITTKNYILNGNVEKTEEVSTEITKSPVNQIVQVGTKKKETSKPTENLTTEEKPEIKLTGTREIIPYDTVYKRDDSRSVDSDNIILDPGGNGEKIIIKVGDIVTEEKDIKQPSSRIVSVGTKPTEIREELEYKTEYIEDNNMYKYTEEVFVEGENGLKTTITSYMLDTKTGKLTPKDNITIKNPVTEIIKRGTKEKVKPVLTITEVEQNPDEKSITAKFSLLDKDKAAVSSKAYIYDGDNLVRELDIENIKDDLKIDGLKYYKDYTIKTVVNYNLGNGENSEEQIDIENFRLDYKKIEIKDIKNIGLYKKDNNNYVRNLTLSSKPTDIENYFVKIKSDRFKEILLPVKEFIEEENYYNVVVSTPELVQDENSIYKQDFKFKIDKKTASEKDGYSSFKSLIEAIKANPRGTYKLSSDISATEVNLDNSAKSYIPGEFRGTLIGSVADKNFAIHDLVKPLFENLKGATVEKLDLKNVNIETKDAVVGALAKSANNSTIIDVSVSGNVVANSQVGGILGTIENRSTVTNVAFEGTVRSLSNSSGDNRVGGVAASLKSKSSISKAKVDIRAYIIANAGEHKAGSLVGSLEAASLMDSYAKGIVTNEGKAGQVGGVVGSISHGGIARNIVSEVKTNANKVHGNSAYSWASISNIYLVDGVSSGKTDIWSNNIITREEADKKVANLNITATLLDSSKLQRNNLYVVDYKDLEDAKEDREIAYYNIEKLIPFYNKELIVYYGNKIDKNSKLYTTKIIDVVAMSGNNFITDIANNKNNINKIMLHFEDNTISYMDVSFKEDFKNNKIAEYTVGDLDLIYTPEQFISNYNNVISSVIADLKSVNYDSQQIRNKLGITSDDTNGQHLGYLYLEESFNKIKEKLEAQLRSILTMDKMINTEGSVIENATIEKIKNNKEAILLGLSYLNRWYDINYGDLNTKELSTFKMDFFGNNDVSVLDTIIKLGNSGYNNLVVKNNVQTYNDSISKATGIKGLFTFLERYRELFLPNKSNNEWLKENSKAYIVESESRIEDVRSLQSASYNKKNNKYSVGVYDKITSDSWELKGMLLPLLTMSEESLYIISNMATLSFGGYERYLYDSGSEQDFKGYVRKLVDQTAIWQRDHQDFWYKILDEKSREKLFRSVPNYDGFNYRNSPTEATWRTLLSKDKSIQDFFGPIGKYYGNSGHGAYANGSETHFVVDRLLGSYGASIYSHEMTHNSDGNIYFKGYDRREGLGAELFALGLLQNPNDINMNIVSLNTMFTGDKDSERRVHTYNPVERFKNVSDLNQYVHGMFDVIYLLDYLEAQSIIKKDNNLKKSWLRRIENYYITDKDGKETHAGNKIRRLTDEEVSKLNNFEAFIDGDILTYRSYGDEVTFGRNSYYTISMFSPLYSALSNDKGAPGDVMFRRMAYELFAAKGYHEGFIPYVSGLYSKEALSNGSKTWSDWFGRYVGLITDDMVFEKVLGREYESWADFKKSMYKERIDKSVNLRPITITYKLGDKNSAEKVTISNIQDVQRLMNEALEKDAKNINNAIREEDSWVYILKQKIYNAYLRLTDDFRESIFEDKEI